MRLHRKLTVFIGAFTAVMIGGAAVAAIAVSGLQSSPPEPTPPASAPASLLDFGFEAPRFVAQAEPITDIAPDWEFTAHQRVEIVDDDPAVNGYWGTSKPGAIVTVESRFGAARTETNNTGHWELKVEFKDMPCNEWFKVVATSGDHTKSFRMKKVCQPDVEVEFTAFQQYGECGEAIPYDVFYGKGTPGATVKVSSGYGSGSTTIDSGGHWELKVEFPTAPSGEVFAVSVASSDGGHADFKFVNVGDAKI